MNAISGSFETKHLNGRQWLVLYIYRQWLSGLSSGDPRHLEFAWSEISTTCRPEPARQVLGALQDLLRVLSDHARRKVTYHPPCCGLTAPDEIELLGLIANLQQGRRAAAEKHARTLVLPTELQSFLAAADGLAEALAAAGLELGAQTEQRLN